VYLRVRLQFGYTANVPSRERPVRLTRFDPAQSAISPISIRGEPVDTGDADQSIVDRRRQRADDAENLFFARVQLVEHAF
jgi:hypothetical protein